MRVEAVSTREVASSCAIEMAIGVGWFLDQVDGLRASLKSKRSNGIALEKSAGAEMKILAAKLGCYSLL